MFITALILSCLSFGNQLSGYAYDYTYEYSYKTQLYSPSVSSSTDNYVIESYLTFNGRFAFDGTGEDYLLSFNTCTFDFKVLESGSNGDYYLVDTDSFTLDMNFYTASAGIDDLFNYYLQVDFTDDPVNMSVFLGKNNEIVDSESYYMGFSYRNYALEYRYEFGVDYNFKQYLFTFMDEKLQGELTYDRGYNDGRGDGYAEGFIDGIDEGASMDGTVITIFNGILSVALVPINFFLGIFNFEILGINITGFVTALVSVCVVIVLIRLIFGSKASGGKE